MIRLVPLSIILLAPPMAFPDIDVHASNLLTSVKNKVQNERTIKQARIPITMDEVENTIQIPLICCDAAKVEGDTLCCTKFSVDNKRLCMNPSNPPCMFCVFNRDGRVPKTFSLQKLFYRNIGVTDITKDTEFNERLITISE